MALEAGHAPRAVHTGQIADVLIDPADGLVPTDQSHAKRTLGQDGLQLLIGPDSLLLRLFLLRDIPGDPGIGNHQTLGILHRRGIGIVPVPVPVFVTDPVLHPFLFLSGFVHPVQKIPAQKHVVRMHKTFERLPFDLRHTVPEQFGPVGRDIGENALRVHCIVEVIGVFHNGSKTLFALSNAFFTFFPFQKRGNQIRGDLQELNLGSLPFPLIPGLVKPQKTGKPPALPDRKNEYGLNALRLEDLTFSGGKFPDGAGNGLIVREPVMPSAEIGKIRNLLKLRVVDFRTDSGCTDFIDLAHADPVIRIFKIFK